MTVTVNGDGGVAGFVVRRALQVRPDGRARLRRRPGAARRPARIGTVGTGCLLEVKDETLGRWLEPGDTVTLEIERLGALARTVVERPAR